MDFSGVLGFLRGLETFRLLGFGGCAEGSPSHWKVCRAVRSSFRGICDLEDGLAGSPEVCSKAELLFLFVCFKP